jgi:hypothetical protein
MDTSHVPFGQVLRKVCLFKPLQSREPLPGHCCSRSLSAPLAPDVAETVDHVGVISGPGGHEVSVPPPRAPSLATDRADRREEQKQNKNEDKLKKRKDRE